VSVGDIPVDVPVVIEKAPVDKDKPQMIKKFEKELIELIENPPENSKSRSPGVGEIHIRQIVDKWKDTFNNPRSAMFPILNKHLGMESDRFDTIMSMGEAKI